MGNIILRGGYLIDPSENICGERDLLIADGHIEEVGFNIRAEKGDRVIDCSHYELWPGLVDMHLHVADLFEISTNTVYCAAQDGVTTALSPGAGNTFMAPALLGAETDRGLPINVGVYLGALNVLGSQLDDEELIALFKGELKDELKWEKLSHNRFTNSFAQYCIGLKEHMGHFLLTDEQIERLYHITSEAGLVFMSHTQDPEHSARLVELSKGRQIHLGHTNAAGCGTHAEAEEGMKAVIGLCKHPNVTGEFVTTMLRRGLGNLEGLKMTKASKQRALDALNEKVVDILVSDGQNQSTMKGFGDTRDNIPCILELVEEGVLDKSAAVAAMTSNPCRYLAEVTGCDEWKCKYGTLREGAYANILIVDTENKRASYTITNGEPVSFEGRYIRGHGYAGNWVSRFGTSRTGVGDAPMYSTDN